jgi:23S rRNA G2069 N7-methylase RlmK/C1962 C5-methylase RlmI
MEDKTTIQAQMLANRLKKRFRHLKKWARIGTQKTGINGAFRLYDRDIPEIPLVLDFYGDCAFPQEAAICGSLYKRPYEKDAADEDNWLCAMKDSIAAALGVAPAFIFLKQRQRQKGISQYEKTGEKRFEKIVSEGSLVFKVNLSDYLDTGLFPDRRLLRVMVREEAAGKKVLNLFSYTGSFSVYAAAGGAASTDSVDLSNTYLSWARENFSLNGMSAGLLPRMEEFFYKNSNAGTGVTGSHKLIRADVLEFLKKAISAKMRWDIIVVDPPAFSNSKKMTDNFDLNRDITDLLCQCLKLLAPDGKVFLSVNLRRAAPTAEDLETELRRQCSPANLCVTDISSKIVDEDFKGKKIPKAFLVKF